MSDFYDAIDAYLDDSTNSDRPLRHAQAILFDFTGAPLRVWGGEGRLTTPGDEKWYGWMGPEGAYLETPKLVDVRDGSSPLYKFTIGFLDDDTYFAARDVADTVRGGDLIIYSVYLPDDSLRTPIPPGDAWRLTMHQATFSESRKRGPDGSVVSLRTASVLAKNANAGRSRTEFGTLSDTQQRARSELLFGVLNDRYCDRTALYSGGYSIQVS